MQHNLEVYGTFAATERLLMELVKAGADRQAMHEMIRCHCLDAWDALQQSPSSENPLADRLAAEPAVLVYLPAGRVRDLLSAGDYVGDAPQRAREMATRIRQVVASSSGH